MLKMNLLRNVFEDVTGLANFSVYGAIALVFLILGKFEQFWQLLAAGILLYAIVLPLRTLKFHDRPKKESYSGWFSKFQANTLVSIHAARAIIMAFVLSAYFEYNIILVALLSLAALGVGISRLVLQKHRLEDVVTGFIVGFVCSAIILYLI
jgi:membrane-associated phospholipid phosphatase